MTNRPLHDFEAWLHKQELKSEDADVTLIILDAKAEIERIKKKYNIG